jgi:hemolysin III
MDHGERLNTITHLIGFVLAIVGTVALLVASPADDVRRTIALSIYGAMLIILYLNSTLYHSVRGRAKKVLHVFDHCSIYLLIAGTYTPITLVLMRDRTGWLIFGIVWALAILGIIKDSVFRGRMRAASVVLYVLMGWTILIGIDPLKQVLPANGLQWLVIGGVIYTAGITFYALSKRVAHMHALWHVFVVGGSIAHYVVVFRYVALS